MESMTLRGGLCEPRSMVELIKPASGPSVEAFATSA